MTLPLVLLPGMMCDARLFGPQISGLGTERSIQTLNISDHETVTELAERILAEAPERFALAGLSMGGIVAMEVVRLARERVARLALLDTNPLAEADAVKSNRSRQMERAMAGQLASVMRDEMKPNYLPDGPKKAGILDLCMDMALGLGPEVFVRQSIALRDRPDQCDTLRHYTGPSLVLCGRQDLLCPVHRHELMHALLPDSRLIVVEDCGHLPTLEQPEITTQFLAEWLAD